MRGLLATPDDSYPHPILTRPCAGRYDGGTETDDLTHADGAAGLEAIAAGEMASKLAPRDAPTRYRCGRLVRRVPGRLQDAIEHFNGCVLANETYPGLREAQEEAIGKMRLLKKPGRGAWYQVLGQILLPVLLMLALSHLFAR